MSNAYLKREYKKQITWIDKNASKHKHNYINPKILVLELKSKTIYYEALQCDKCNSFTGNNTIFKEKLTEEQEKLPKIFAKSKSDIYNVFNNTNIIEISFNK